MRFFTYRPLTAAARLIPLWIMSFAAILCADPPGTLAQVAYHVIHVSVDGLRPDAITGLGPVSCPALHRLMIEGAFTLNARADCDYTNTLPNHTCQMTGRHVLGTDGHGVSFNSDTGGTIADAHGAYVAGAFDIAHDSGLFTALFCGKEKFAIFDRSWNGVNGAPDITGEDDGRDKIDRYMYLSDTPALVDSFISLMHASRPGYALLHLTDPDAAGHAYGWESPEYLESVIRMDAAIGMVIEAAESDPVLAGATAVIVTADHGGTGTDHSEASDPHNYTVPFLAWGPAIPAGADIYSLNPVSRLDPGAGRPPCNASVPPVRNGDAANLSGLLLGLPPVPGSTIGYTHDLDVTAVGPLPSVSIVFPPDGSQYGPDETVAIEVDASSSAGIAEVEFFADWRLIGEDDTPPYELLWDELPLGTREIAARAKDGSGYAATDMIMIEIVSATYSEPAGISRRSDPYVYPNPSGGSPKLYMDIDLPGPLKISLFDAAGRLVGKRTGYFRSSGRYMLELETGSFPSGVYFFRASSGGGTRCGKFVLIR
jgi:hypothetical protein